MHFPAGGGATPPITGTCVPGREGGMEEERGGCLCVFPYKVSLSFLSSKDSLRSPPLMAMLLTPSLFSLPFPPSLPPLLPLFV